MKKRLSASGRALVVGVSVALCGCAAFQTVNKPLKDIDPSGGYRRFAATKPINLGDVWLSVAFSGGGTRAAAFAYGVLEELRDTQITVDGRSVRLLDEIDSISAVSGGTFPAAYYGLYGDRIFEDFEQKFLYKNVQRALLFRALRPWNLLRLITPSFSRSLLALDYYDQKVFDQATFEDLATATGPHIHINATDLSHGYRFTFNQGQFDVICSDLDQLPVAAAVAASSAVPLLLSPIVLKNYAGSCQYQVPDWVNDSLDARRSDRRRYEAALAFTDFSDIDDRPYIHLIDGGIADNLGLRFAIELTAAAGGARRFAEATKLESPENFVIIVVNAETDPNPKIDLSSASPSFAAMMASVSGSQIRRYNLETLLLLEESVEDWAEVLAERTETPVRGSLIEVSFDSIAQEEERGYFKLIPTSFALGDKTVDDLREAGRRLLRENPEFQALLETLR